MQYTIDTDVEFLRVKVWGREIDRPPSEICSIILAESKKADRKRILIELDQKFPLSPTNQFNVVTKLPELGFTHEHRVALVHSTQEMSDANQFINLFARTHGVMVRNFPSIEGAKAWLRGDAAAKI